MTAFTLPRLGTIAAACALLLPGLAQSRPVTITTQLKNYNGDGAYLAVYLTNAQGAYAGTLWVAGSKAKYYKHLSAWSRLSAADNQRLLIQLPPAGEAWQAVHDRLARAAQALPDSD